MHTKESIINLLRTNDKAIGRALVALTARQTTDERASENTRYHNGRGYRPAHARMGTSMSRYFERNGYLTPKQIAYWRVKMRDGKMRIEIYAGQLLEVAREREAAKLAAPVVQMQQDQPTRDLGNDMELKMVLQERLGDVLDSDDPVIIDPIVAEIDEIDAYWAKIQALQGK